MSKRELKAYLKELSKEQLEDQIQDLYSRFKEVKEYYDFAFNPKENVLLEQCRFQIGKEYFPVNGRKAKVRRSVAQKWIRKLKTLGADPSLIADVMLYNIEIAQAYSDEKYISSDAFFRSIYKSFEEAVKYISDNALNLDFSNRVEAIIDNTIRQNWQNKNSFEKFADLYLGGA